MPGPVNSTSAASAIAALVRHAVAGQAQASKRAGPSDKARKGAGKGAASDKQSGTAPLAELIAKRAEELNPDASDYRSRLLRLVIEASLLHELGSNLLNAPKFQAMVDQVLHELESAPQLKRDVSTVLDGLAKGHWPAA